MPDSDPMTAEATPAMWPTGSMARALKLPNGKVVCVDPRVIAETTKVVRNSQEYYTAIVFAVVSAVILLIAYLYRGRIFSWMKHRHEI